MLHRKAGLLHEPQERREVGNARLLELAESQDAITRRDAMSLLNLSEAAAYERLRQLTVQGRLVRVGQQYYLPEQEEVL